MLHRFVWVILIYVLAHASTAGDMCAQESLESRGVTQDGWTWKDRKGKIRTRAELDEILEGREEVDLHGADLRRVDFSQADLIGANLRGANLSGANLSGADLNEAHLRRANLTGASLIDTILPRADLREATLNQADLRGADLFEANLTGATLIGADLGEANLNKAILIGTILTDAKLQDAHLNGAILTDAKLRRAILRQADLREADLVRADLNKADLTDADLRGARLKSADLKGAIYQPRKNPTAQDIADAYNLDSMTYRSNSGPLTTLRTSLEKAGYEKQVRLLNVAKRRHDANILEIVLYDWTCEFGTNASRPVWIIGWIFLACALLYWWCLLVPSGSFLYLVASGKKFNKGNEGRLHALRLRCRRPEQSRSVFELVRREVKALGTAFLFSFTSTLNIGYGDFNLARWSSMLQPREFEIKARGWPRVVSGAQSLLSLFLFALSLLSYFGQPFEG